MPLTKRNTYKITNRDGMEMNTIVNQLTGWIDYLKNIKAEQHEEFFKTIAEGKWSKAAIIAHIFYWDRFFYEKRLPAMLEGGTLPSIDTSYVEEMNNKADKYAHSGIQLSDLINKAIKQREILVDSLKDQDLSQTFIINDNKYTLESYVKGEVEHDQHHLKQLKG